MHQKPHLFNKVPVAAPESSPDRIPPQRNPTQPVPTNKAATVDPPNNFEPSPVEARESLATEEQDAVHPLLLGKEGRDQVGLGGGGLGGDILCFGFRVFWGVCDFRA